MKTSPKRKNAQLSKSATNKKKGLWLVEKMDRLGRKVPQTDQQSTRVDVEFKCGCDICKEKKITVYYVRLGPITWVTDSAEHAIALAEFSVSAVFIWTSEMTRAEYQSIPEPRTSIMYGTASSSDAAGALFNA